MRGLPFRRLRQFRPVFAVFETEEILALIAGGNHIAGQGWIPARTDFISALASCWSWWA